MKNDAYYMNKALELAAKGLGHTHPNPPVGAVIVKNGRVIGSGYHKKAGLAHAEIEALRVCKTSPAGAVLYVTLEPCSHFGKTPPCADAIIKNKLKKVVIGTRDPNPLVAGRGIKKLRRAGIETVCGVMKEEAGGLIRYFSKFITSGLPYITLKAASTIDGRIAAKGGDSKYITSPESRTIVHLLRSINDAVLIGSGTALADNPLLDTRLLGPGARKPVKIILDAGDRLTGREKLFHSGRTIVFSGAAGRLKDAENITVVRNCGSDIKKIMKKTAELGLTSVLVEGGSEIFTAFIKARLADELLVFYSPSVFGADGIPMLGALGIKSAAGRLKASLLSAGVAGGDLAARFKINY